MKLKKEFVERSKQLLGDEYKEYLDILFVPLKNAIRVNTLKIRKEDLIKRLKEKGWVLEQIPWCKLGYWVKKPETRLGATLEYFLGYYYNQEAASMIPPLLMELKEGQRILDIAASPGSKTTQIAGLINDEGVIVANDVRIDRISILKANLQRMGVRCAILTKRSKGFPELENYFDRVLVDAPCSGEGIIRKKPYVAVQWNKRNFKHLSRVQKNILLNAYNTLKPGGILVYSTCSLAPEENEEVVNFLLQKTNAKLLPTKLKGLKAKPGVVEWEKKQFDESIKLCSRIYPHLNDTEGFFVAKILKR